VRVTHTNANGDGHSYCNCNANSDGYGYGDCNAYTYTDTGADHAARKWLQNTRPAKGGPLLEWADLG
jgi:hypothetical protein